jgi:hypothetical protein
MSEGALVKVAGWYFDPDGAFLMRWWDGHAWTEHTSPMQVPAAASTPEPQAVVTPVAAKPTGLRRETPKAIKWIVYVVVGGMIALTILRVLSMGAHYN